MIDEYKINENLYYLLLNLLAYSVNFIMVAHIEAENCHNRDPNKANINKDKVSKLILYRQSFESAFKILCFCEFSLNNTNNTINRTTTKNK